MLKVPSLDKNIYLKVGDDQALPLLQAGKLLPARWQGPFTRALSNLGAFDVQLLFGSSLVASENITIGRWRISGIPEDESVTGELLVKVTVGKAGNVQVDATFNEDMLKVVILPGVLRNVPVQQEITSEGIKASEEGIIEPDLPNSSRRDQHPREQEIHNWGDMMVETTVVKTQSDSGSDGNNPAPSMSLDNVEMFIRKGSGNILDDDTVQEIIGRPLEGEPPTNSPYFFIPREEEVQSEGLESDLNTTGGLGCFMGLLQMFGLGRQELKVTYAKSPLLGDRPFKRGLLELEDLIRQKGPPPSPEELLSCPNCNAKISKDEIKCPWCSEQLAVSEETRVVEDQNE